MVCVPVSTWATVVVVVTMFWMAVTAHTNIQKVHHRDTHLLQHTHTRMYDDQFKSFKFNFFMFQFGGEFSPVFRMFLHFISYHQDLTVTVITDLSSFAPYQEIVPANVKLYPTTLGKIENMTNDLLEITDDDKRVRIERPYKVCDYRVLYAILFADALQGFTHWGWIDHDVLMGTLFTPHLFPPGHALLSPETRYLHYDVLGINWAYHTNGPLSLLKNNEKMIQMWRNISYFYSTLFTYPHKPAGMEEIHLHYSLTLQESIGNVTIYKPPLNGLECGDNWVWYNGTMVEIGKNAAQECVYFHFGGATGKRFKIFGRSFMPVFDEFVKGGYTLRNDVGIMQVSSHWKAGHFLFEIIRLEQEPPLFDVLVMHNVTDQEIHSAVMEHLPKITQHYVSYLNNPSRRGR